MGFPYTMAKASARLAQADLRQAVLVLHESDIEGYDWGHQEVRLALAAVARLERSRADRLLRSAVGRAFVVTLAGRRLYGGLFYPQGGAAAIRFPVIHALGEPLAILRIRPAQGHGWTPGEPRLAEQCAAIADPALADWLARAKLMRSKEVAMSLEFLETIGGPKGEAEIHEQKPDGLAVLIDSKKYMVRFNGRLVGHYASLHDARSKANDLTGNNG